MNEQTYPRPGAVTAIAVMTLVSGIVNVLWGVAASLGAVHSKILLCCLAPFFLAQLVFGVYEIVYASKLLYNPPQPIQPSTTIAILEISTILVCNAFSPIVGILVLVFYNDPQVKAYFAGINAAGPACAAVLPPSVDVTPPPATPEAPSAPFEPQAPKPPRAPRQKKTG